MPFIILSKNVKSCNFLPSPVFNCTIRALSFGEHRKQTVNGQPLSPTWQPMTSTVGVFGLLHFSLHTMEGESTGLLIFEHIGWKFILDVWQYCLHVQSDCSVKIAFPSHADDCTSARSSSVYQQGEAVFLEASVEAPQHLALALYVDYCVATLNSDPLSSPSYEFISKHG